MHVDRNGHGLPGHPFCPAENDLTKVCTKLYAKGLRNPFRFTLRPAPLGPVVGDVGWETWEEIDLVAARKELRLALLRGPRAHERLPGPLRMHAAVPGRGDGERRRAADLRHGPLRRAQLLLGDRRRPVLPGRPLPGRLRRLDVLRQLRRQVHKAADVRRQRQRHRARSRSPPTGRASTSSSGRGNEIYYTNFADGSNGTGSVRRIVYVLGRQLDADRHGRRGTPVSGRAAAAT